MRNRGLSLVEALIATALGSVVIYFGATLLFGANKTVKKQQERFTSRTLTAVVSGSLQKYMASGDLRFLAFPGLGTSDKLTVRAVIPFPGRCADPSNASDLSCPEDTSLTYAHYDKLTTPTITVICNYVTPSAGNSFTGSWLVDLNNETYGKISVVPTGFSITGPADAPYVRGPVDVTVNSTENQLLALMNPPVASLWVATSPPTKVNFTLTSTTPVTFTPALPPDCLKNLQTDTSAAGVKFDQLYSVSYRPFVLSQFTGGTLTGFDDATASPVNAQGAYPLRLFATNFRAVGRFKAPNNNYEFGLRECRTRVQTSVSNIICDGKTIATIPDVKKSRIEEVFNIKMKTSNAERFELKEGTQTLFSTCAAPTCAALDLKAVNVPVAGVINFNSSTPETFENLDSTTFSYLKQEALQKLRYKLVNTNDREETFDILFP